VVTDIELGKEDNGSILATAIRRRLESLNARTDPEPD
jgi:hypothetical protein